MKDIKTRFMEKTSPPNKNGCVIWIGAISRNGYGHILYAAHLHGAHRIAWRLSRGSIPKGMCVLHKCDVRACVNSDHLFLGTMSDNSKDMVSKNRHTRIKSKGENHYNAKLSNKDVKNIRRDNRPAVAVAKDYEVSDVTIGLIRKNKSWKNP